jgi:hypothetical protein
MTKQNNKKQTEATERDLERKGKGRSDRPALPRPAPAPRRLSDPGAGKGHCRQYRR